MHISSPSIPFCSPVGYISPGTLIRITGNVQPYCQCFAINLQCGGSVNPRDDVALHLSPVFSPPPRIVRNSIQSNSWGPEESFGGFPLSPGQSFEFMIMVEPSQFKIALNGAHFTEFRHRLPFERISHIAIDGDVRIDMVSVDGGSGGGGMPMAGAVPYGMGGGAPYPPMGFEAMPSFPAEAPPAYSAKSAYPTVPPVAPGGYNPGSYDYGQQQYPQAQQYPAGQQYPQGQYPAGQYGPGGYPGAQPAKPKDNSIGGKVAAALGGLTAGAAATSIGSSLFGGGNKHGSGSGSHMPHMPGMPGVSGPSHKPHKSSSGIPIGAIAAGVGATALGAAVLSKVHPFKKAKKMFKHKHKGGWHHKGWSSSSSSSSSEEE